MKFLGIGKVNKTTPSETAYIVEITEREADEITGVAGKPHISGRYKPGMTVNISVIYDKVKAINESHAEIVAAVAEVKADADDIANAIPLT
ncbi:hypothetical protein LCGC14_0400410 [marine sediment metagenome]|uniref:Uncharacterized protein n=1 Tax=marine sediment metagenome TaxID=412755 RepID=A0A0F9VIW8_9ZZZZ